jgi:hypothetical protein
LAEKVFHGTGEYFGHPHNGYFQFALDNGIIGLAVFLMLFGTLLLMSGALFRSDNPQATAAGGMAFALLTSFLIAAAGAQTFYPTELSLGVWCAIGLLMRVSLQAAHAQDAPVSVPLVDVTGTAKAARMRWRLRRLANASKFQRDRAPVAKTRRSRSNKPILR